MDRDKPSTVAGKEDGRGERRREKGEADRANLCQREDEEGKEARREDECASGRAEGRGKRERVDVYHHEVRRRGGRNAADAEQKPSALSAMLFAGITVSNHSPPGRF